MRNSARFLAFLAISVYFILSLESKGAETTDSLIDLETITNIKWK